MVSRLGINAWKLVLISTLLSFCCYAQELDIRLFGGSGNYEGRVEVRVNGQWGTVCNETWDMDDATVVCRELGDRTAIKYDVMYGEGEGPILYTNSTCTGEEERLQDCPHEEPTVDVCQHTQDAGVQCSFKDVDLRLVGGLTPNEGRVEVYKKNTDGTGEWGRVCAGSEWDRNEANVVCRTVGYPNGAEASSGSFESGTGRVFIIDLECTGKENTVLGCEKANFGDLQGCPSDEVDATVVCISEVKTEELSKGAIAGIGVGFGLVIIMCCIFSLNCKCRPFWKKREVDETDVYAAASKVLSTTSNLKSESDTRQDSISDIDPNMFIFAPKNPPPGFGMSDASGTNGVLPNIDETKEPNGDHVAVSMTTEENEDDIHLYDDVELILGEGIDTHDEKESEVVTIDEQGGAYFKRESHDLDDHDYGEIVDNDNAEIVDNDDTELGGNDYLELVDNGNPEIVDNDNAEIVDNDYTELGGNDYLELVDNGNPEIVDNDNAEIVDNDDTEFGENDYLDPLDNRNPEIVDYAEIVDNANPVLRENDYLELVDNENPEIVENESVLTDQQAGGHSKTGMTDEDNDPSESFFRMELENSTLL
ncbi:lysyl oxidase homolog 2 isoform X2 [Strongylocentrotus purpuratus]|uniref:SRCR domain-containing protein n=1 Tax=Strongylocentrotus purpuratus TaxID=7668 RepID=A0A7M7N5Q6_STRPU|nr:lysyl oxidase homolog 2 isoform X2 [Strongylocentrotus purpuratus]